MTVIIPVYNVEKYIAKCLESVLKQTYKNIEIVIIDDGTKDSSGMICDDYAKKDFRIKVIHQKNQGLSGARNTGLKIATGDYITFLDSDDFIDEKMLEEMLLALKKNNADIVECGTIYCNEDETFIRENTKDELRVYKNEYQIKELVFLGNITTTSWGKLYKKKLFKNFEFPLGKYHEDTFTTYKLLHLSSKTIVLNKSFYYYRQVNGSIMNSKFNIKHLDSIDATIERSKFIEKYYPMYKKYEYANIVYSCCKVYERMILEDFYNKNIMLKLQELIRKNLIYFYFYSKSKKITKIFASICFINMNLCKILYNFSLSKVKK
ncbi:glycosyltransferase family 2 protein [Fusobacterium varium]|nr:glycosyltransferase family 2 protein [Fusobacterium varium]